MSEKTYFADQLTDGLSPVAAKEIMGKAKNIELIDGPVPEMFESRHKIDWHEDSNIFCTGPTGWEATFERLLILEDQFRSGYECDTCEQTGKLACSECDTLGYSRVNANIKCKACNGTKQVNCPDCKGKGVLLEIPEVAQRRPTTGTVLSVGEDVKTIKRGDTVVYSNFVGEVYDLTGVDSVGREKKIVIRVMKEREIICRIYGHMELKRVSRHQSQTGG